MPRNLSLIVLVLALYKEVIGDSKDNPEEFLDVSGMIVYNGYPTQTHTVVTEDGYALTVHRIPHGRGKRNSTYCDKGVVLLQHGISGSSASWVYTGKDNALSYMLADQGYDVWLPNVRGNEYSTMHTPQRDPRTKEFWNFSLDEGGVYDLPAVIDYILKKTGKEKIIYVGHSMGTTLFYIMMSQRPEYNQKITVMISLAPIAYTSHSKNALGNVLGYLYDPLSKLLNLIGFTHIIATPHVLSKIGPLLCIETPVISYICQKFLISVMETDLHSLNQTFIPVYLNNVNAGASYMQLMHCVQLSNSGRFCQYDYGKSENLIRYNSTQPPSYNISETKVPVAILHSDGDNVADVTDVMKLYNELPNVIKLQKVESKDFKHEDFIAHKDVATLVNKPVIDILHLYCT
ncbi:gastric triacylglycerol lipase-like [Periplaneta americana]|uniref:gastric triacylglycerol lipase-like n=1 Tax=Periplaneta americana TaxID=6978 RepID=UPI0037E9796F